MTIAIGGWVLLSMVICGDVPCRTTVNDAVQKGLVVKGFDTAEDCEKARRDGQVCVPALALVNR